MVTTPNPTTEKEFKDQMEILIRSAEANDLNVEGAYDFRTDDSRPDWEWRSLNSHREKT